MNHVDFFFFFKFLLVTLLGYHSKIMHAVPYSAAYVTTQKCKPLVQYRKRRGKMCVLKDFD